MLLVSRRTARHLRLALPGVICLRLAIGCVGTFDEAPSSALHASVAPASMGCPNTIPSYAIGEAAILSVASLTITTETDCTCMQQEDGSGCSSVDVSADRCQGPQAEETETPYTASCGSSSSKDVPVPSAVVQIVRVGSDAPSGCTSTVLARADGGPLQFAISCPSSELVTLLVSAPDPTSSGASAQAFDPSLEYLDFGCAQIVSGADAGHEDADALDGGSGRDDGATVDAADTD